DLAPLAPARPFVEFAALVDQGHVLAARVGAEGSQTRLRPVIAAALDKSRLRSLVDFEQRHPADARRLSQAAQQLLYAVVPVRADDDPGRRVADRIADGVVAPAPVPPRLCRPERCCRVTPWSRWHRCHVVDYAFQAGAWQSWSKFR